MPTSTQTVRPCVRSAVCGHVSADLPLITAENVEHYLASDDILVHFFNEFLSLPSFPEALSYQRDSDLFEVEDGAAERASRRISSVLQEGKCGGLPEEEQALLALSGPLVDNRYTAQCLDKTQGLKWITAERLPFFVQSDCYFEYKLAKLLSQWAPGPCVHKTDDGSFRGSPYAPRSPTLRVDAGTRTEGWCTPPGEPGENRPTLTPLGPTLEGWRRRAEEEEVEEKTDGEPGRGEIILEDEEDEEVEEDIIEEEDEEVTEKMEERRRDVAKENVLELCCWGARFHGAGQSLDEFREFVQDTPGERILLLWMDIERLTSTPHWEGKNRHLVLMRGRYMQSNSPCSLSPELLSHLGLTTTPCWTEEKLRQVQRCLTEALLCYWAPSFCMSRWNQGDGAGPSWCPEPWAEGGQEDQGECFPRTSMETMLQALHADPHAGLYFTRFCELSGNPLWENAIHFWNDLQRYHQLFYRDSLDPNTVQREAQLLYSRFLSPLAPRGSVGLGEDERRAVCACLQPAFEELFDGVEQHVLDLLLEPWTLLVTRDLLSYQTVCVQEQERALDSEEFRELQSLREEAQVRLRELQQRRRPSSPCPPPPPPPPEAPRTPNPWAKVLPRYHGYRLGSLLRSSQEIQHFTSFLQEREASVHLRCWTDLEQYRRTPHRDKAAREGRSADIADRYLNRKYFLGPNSPASAIQQNEILHRAGGAERLKQECLSDTLVGEIQSIVRSHIEKTWLPLFLATEGFVERQNNRQLRAAAGLSERVNHHRKRRAASKARPGLWMSSTKEILVLRRVLLNPASCHYFQRFAALQGDFLENDVLFWLEVQKYKELCHSHSDEATVQRKVSTIISCFIRSNVPPALQIDIPPEQARTILERRPQLGPYIFREAQMSVFSELMRLWPDFQALSSGVHQEQLLSVLEEQEQKHRASLQRRRRREEQRSAQEERRQLSLTEEDEEKSDGWRDGTRREDQLSKALHLPTKQLSWSYSKHMEALKRSEEEMLRKKTQQDVASRSTTPSDSAPSRSSLSSLVSRRSPKRSSVSSIQLR